LRYAVISDVHSNLEALEAVLEALEGENIDAYLSTGDIVGYGADPAACVERIRSLDPHIVAGNHDWAVAGTLSLDFFNSYAREAIEWTRGRLNGTDVEWLRNLKLVRKVGKVTLVHSTLHSPESFDYLLTAYDAHLSLEVLETPVCFVGHSHVPVTFAQNGTVTFSFAEEISLEGVHRAIVNAGSVGQPRDGNPHASFGIYDSEKSLVQVRRVAYDVGAAAKKIVDRGLPPVLAERLWVGR
jgi:diadenosine tetraphosphatase ApaH/serine/threonine PP2A family protein phosphatase